MYFKTHANLEIVGNNFTKCNGVNSLITVSKQSDDHAVLIHQNYFGQNSVLSGSNTIFIEILTDVDFSTVVSSFNDTMV